MMHFPIFIPVESELIVFRKKVVLNLVRKDGSGLKIERFDFEEDN